MSIRGGQHAQALSTLLSAQYATTPQAPGPDQASRPASSWPQSPDFCRVSLSAQDCVMSTISNALSMHTSLLRRGPARALVLASARVSLRPCRVDA